MPNVTVTPPASIVVRVGGTNQSQISTTNQFVGSPGQQAKIDAAYDEANAAYSLATTALVQSNTALIQVGAAYAQSNAAYLQANTALLQVGAAYNQSNAAYYLANNALLRTGGEVTGNLIVDGTFLAVVDAGTF